MTLHKLIYRSDDYVVTTEVFEGPLDLLLELIERAQLDITRLALAQVTDQYLAYLHSITEQNAADVSAFLVIAAKLLQIKSEALLPRPPEHEAGEEDLGESLARQLITYRKFKRAAELLARRVEAHIQTYLRLTPPGKVEGLFNLNGLTLTDLVLAALTVYQNHNDSPSVSTVITMPKITIREKIGLILSSLNKKGIESFRSLLGASRTRIEAVVTFLAVLELIKRQYIEVRQDNLFADIFIQPIGSWKIEDEFDLEFGE